VEKYFGERAFHFIERIASVQITISHFSINTKSHVIHYLFGVVRGVEEA
jgi:hypothetical protein